MEEFIKTGTTVYQVGGFTVKIQIFHNCLFRAVVLRNQTQVAFVTEVYTTEAEPTQIAFNHIRDFSLLGNIK